MVNMVPLGTNQLQENIMHYR